MPITYEYNNKNNLVSTTITGALHSNDIIGHLHRLIKDKEIKSNFIELVDFNAVEDLILKYTDLVSIAGLTNKLVEGHRLSIFSAYNEFTQAMLGMMMHLFHSVELNVIICKNEKELESNLSVFLECNS